MSFGLGEAARSKSEARISMDGFVDELNQAFLTVDLGNGPIDFQIDTGFSGAFLIGEEVFDLEHAVETEVVEAVLAADNSQTFQGYELVIQWLAEETLVPILVGPGKDFLIGNAMLNPHRLEIDFGPRTVRLIENGNW